MARSEGSSSGASQLPKSEATTIAIIPTRRKIPRRQLTLIIITVCLNILLWSSIFSLIASFYLFGADSRDITMLVSQILTLTSAFVSILYTILHTVVSRKQKTWSETRLQSSLLKKTCYVAIRLAVTLCILWLLTSGWNLITAARQPVCLPSSTHKPGWETGPTCVVSRISATMSLIALIASCVLFGILAVVRRPFEADLFRNVYNPPACPTTTTTPKSSARPSRTVSFSSSTSRSRSSMRTASVSNPDIEALDLDAPLPPIPPSSPPFVHSLGLGMFASHTQPPPLPPMLYPLRTTSLYSLPHTNTFPQRKSSLGSALPLVPLPVPPAFADSAWRAIHPPLPITYDRRLSASLSLPHLPNPAPNFSHTAPYSRSMVSLTRPHRLSGLPAPPSVAYSTRSSRSGASTEVSSSAGGSGSARSALRRISGVVDGDVTGLGGGIGVGVGIGVGPGVAVRRSKQWRPQLEGQEEGFEGLPVKIPITFFGEEKRQSVRAMGFEQELEVRLGLATAVGVRKARSMSPLRSIDGMGAGPRMGRRGLGGSSGSLGSRVEKLRMEAI
ncbi:hypothetical protein AOQ84DRAFT_392786 [Glonium stellatum]|uniref:Uncharacterized protein n=1 Tax=Glonium stellatum TaxID=574774 RepID=A0A8E2EQ26_9PEZI|nr:hypothetical protein AOQ84DRAFT_392786 [Glonium stellatum]